MIQSQCKYGTACNIFCFGEWVFKITWVLQECLEKIAAIFWVHSGKKKSYILLKVPADTTCTTALP